jgi:glycosyltransferase involved in cell wall biosynthesis
MHIGLNAHLLSSRAGYRTAGIHGYIAGLLAHLPQVLPADWRLTAMVGRAFQGRFAGVHLRHARFDTETPLRRIAWEQLVQPWGTHQYDLVHQLAFVAPVATRTPTVVTVYDLSFVHYPEYLSAARRAYLRAFTRTTCQRAARVLAISQSTADDLTHTYAIPPDKIDIAYPGYDAARMRPLPPETVAAFRAQHDLPQRFWLFIGTLEPRKNLLTLLRAYAALPAAQRLPLIIGGGKGWNYEPIFEAVRRYHLHDVRFIGFVPSESLPLWYNSAETFFFPSVFEGFGLPVLEAMACGTPVVVSSASSLPEIAGEAGLCLPPHEPDAWAQAMQQVAADDAWRAQASARGQQVAAGFSWMRTAERTAASYAHILIRERS